MNQIKLPQKCWLYRCDRYYAYHDPVGRFLLGMYAPFMRRLIGTDIRPCYTYFIEYVPGRWALPESISAK